MSKAEEVFEALKKQKIQLVQRKAFGFNDLFSTVMNGKTQTPAAYTIQ